MIGNIRIFSVKIFFQSILDDMCSTTGVTKAVVCVILYVR